MGYTHYYRREAILYKETFKLFVKDVKRIMQMAKFLDVKLAGPFGEGGTKPIVNASKISFNGFGEDSHETLCIPRRKTRQNLHSSDTLIFDFCKTARKPYDRIAVAVLVAFKHHFPGSKISSDGDEDAFELGKNICQLLFGYGNNVNIIEEEEAEGDVY